jgi:hypothetical protein
METVIRDDALGVLLFDGDLGALSGGFTMMCLISRKAAPGSVLSVLADAIPG